MKPRKLALLVAILALGGGVESAWELREHVGIGPAGCRVLGGRFYGRSFSFEEEERRELGPGTRVEVLNSFGGIKIGAGEAGRLKVRLRKVVYLERESSAREFAARIALRLEQDGTLVRVSTNRDGLEHGDSDVGLETHIELLVPPDTPVSARNAHGGIEVADVASADLETSYDGIRVQRVAGDTAVRGRHGEIAAFEIGGVLTASSRYGDVRIADVTGKTSLNVEHGDIQAARVGSLGVELRNGDLDAETVRGELDVDASHASVKASDVAGGARIATSNQDVHVANVAGDARIETHHGGVDGSDLHGGVTVVASYGDVVLGSVGGPAEVKVDHGGLKARGLAQGAKVQVLGGDAVLEGFRGGLEVLADRAGVELRPDAPLTDPVAATSRFGTIQLSVPAESRFDLLAAAPRGQVSVRLPGFAVSESSAKRVAGRLAGGGSMVNLSSDHGDVRVEERVAEVAEAP